MSTTDTTATDAGTTDATTDTTATDAGTTDATTDTSATGGDTATRATDRVGTDATSGEWANFDADRAKRTIENQRRVESELKRQNAEMRSKLDEIERAKLSDNERAAADLKAVQADIAAAREQVASARFEAAALAAGIPADRLTAARAVAGDVVVSGDAGNVSIDTDALARLKDQHGYLFEAKAAPANTVSFGAASGQGPDGTGTGLTPEQIEMARRAGMTPDDFAKFAQRTTR